MTIQNSVESHSTIEFLSRDCNLIIMLIVAEYGQE
jgi:hypothetical protein